MYKLNFKCQLKTLGISLFSILAIFSILLINQIFNHEKIDWELALICVLVLNTVSIYLYFEYLIASFNNKVSIDSFNKLIEIRNKGSFIQYQYEDVKKITLICSHAKGENRSYRLPWDSFFYYIIELKDDSEHIITSLMTESFSLYGIKNEVKKSLFPSILYMRLPE